MKNIDTLKRESPAGRWIPAGFFSANIISWLAIGIIAAAWSLLLLIIIPVSVLIFYILCTGRKRP